MMTMRVTAWEAWLPRARNRGSGQLLDLLLEHFFDLPDLLLNFAGQFFDPAFGFQVRIVSDLACFLFDFTCRFVKLAFDLIFRTWFHVFSLFHLFLSKRLIC